jgi:anti-sigma regulatory factor (Ser/Thr protein kinase)
MIRLADSGPADHCGGTHNSQGGAGRAPPGDPLPFDRRFDATSLGKLRAAVARHAAAAGLSADRVQDAVIAIHELASNAVRHGAGYGRVQQWKDRQLLHSRVSDPGAASNSAGVPADQHQQPWPAQHSHGLWLVRQVADQVIMRHGRGGTSITISFAIDPA